MSNKEEEMEKFLKHMEIREQKGMGWNLDAIIDPDGEVQFIEDFVQGMWIGWFARSEAKS